MLGGAQGEMMDAVSDDLLIGIAANDIVNTITLAPVKEGPSTLGFLYSFDLPVAVCV